MKNIILILALIFIFINSYSQNDTIYLSNNDMLVGELKSMDKGVFIFETDYSDSDFKIEWSKLKNLKSDRSFIITLSNGDRYFGNISADPKNPKNVVIKDKDGEISTEVKNIVFIKAVEGKFKNRLSLLISAGYTFTKANNLNQITARSNVGYLTPKLGFEGSFNTVRSIQDSVSPTNRTDGNIGINFFLPKDWFLMTSAVFLKNDEQKLDLRTNLKLGAGNYLVHTNMVYLGVSAGIAYNIENYWGHDNDRKSFEGFFGGELNIFDMGDLSLLTKIVAYPSFTEAGRWRSDFSFDLKYDFFKDFFINLGFTFNYDNQPVEGGSDMDYVIQSTIGWEL